jgi:hypothetical protein
MAACPRSVANSDNTVINTAQRKARKNTSMTIKQCPIRMTDELYNEVKEMHIDYISDTRSPISFNVFVGQLLKGMVEDMKTRAGKKVEALLKDTDA